MMCAVMMAVACDSASITLKAVELPPYARRFSAGGVHRQEMGPDCAQRNDLGW